MTLKALLLQNQPCLVSSVPAVCFTSGSQLVVCNDDTFFNSVATPAGPRVVPWNGSPEDDDSFMGPSNPKLEFTQLCTVPTDFNGMNMSSGPEYAKSKQ